MVHNSYNISLAMYCLMNFQTTSMKRLGQLSAGCLSNHVRHHWPCVLRRSSSAADPKVNFLALEAKWQAKRETKEGNLPESEGLKSKIHPLAPSYSKYFRRVSVLDTLKRCNGEKSIAPTNRNGKGGIFDSVVELANPCFDTLPVYQSNDTNWEKCIEEYGSDIARTYTVFQDAIIQKSPSCGLDIIQIREWFESIWKATILAHESYIGSQAIWPDSPEVPEAVLKPDPDGWDDYISYGLESLVHMVPDEPDISKLQDDKDACKVWLAAQQALQSMIQPINGQNNLRTIRSHLVALTEAIVTYDDDAHRVMVDVHYHSARILLCLIAPLTPSFAEECWVMLHYGPNAESEIEDNIMDVQFACGDGDGSKLQGIRNYLAEDKDSEYFRDLPKRGHPETLSSIFDQPFPVVADEKAIDLLKISSLL